jgi:hypothetical protein
MRYSKLLNKRFGCMVVVEVNGSKVKARCDCGVVRELWYTATYQQRKHCPACKPKAKPKYHYFLRDRYNITLEEAAKLPSRELDQMVLIDGQWYRRGNRIKFAGLALTTLEWALVCGVSKQRIQQRLQRGVYDALKKYEDRILAYLADPSTVPGVRPVPDNWDRLPAVRSDEETCAQRV